MKKVLLFGIMGALAFGVWACGDDEDDNNGNGTGSGGTGAGDTGGTGVGDTGGTGGDEIGGTGGEDATGGTGGDETGGTGGGGVEDECQQCLQAKCTTHLSACQDNAACAAILECQAECTSPVCEIGCADSNPDGMQAFSVLGQCRFEQCGSECIKQ